MISLICAMDRNGVIGNSKINDMPWGRTIPEDLGFFRQQTLEQVIVYGRKTFESMSSNPLPFRINIILTHKPFNIHPNTHSTTAFTLSSVEDVINYHEHYVKNKMFICGGANIYEQFLPFADELIITHIDAEFEGDVYFPVKNQFLKFLESEIIKTVPISEYSPYPLKMIRYFNKRT